MARWILKEEPAHYAFEDLVREKATIWDGVTNPLALRHLRTARKGDSAIIYHTGGVKAAVGLAEIASDPFPDPRTGDARLVVVRVKAGAPLPQPVSLAAMKANPKLAGLDLLRIPRLSVVPVGEAHWEEILRMAGAGRGPDAPGGAAVSARRAAPPAASRR
jgi:predicted RNA-binding protein with PUA-like domain